MAEVPVLSAARHIPFYILKPFRFFSSYDRGDLRPDVIAGITVAVILLPQAIAFALIAELPPEMGLYAAVVAAVVGALWGSSNQVHNGPTNAISLLVFSALLSGNAQPGTPEFLVAAGLMAVMVGLFQLVLGFARLGVLVNFVSHSVVVGFASGAGVLIAVKQMRHLLGIEFASHNLIETIEGLATHLTETHRATALVGAATMAIAIGMRVRNPRLPWALTGMVFASLAVFLFDLARRGVAVIGQLPSSLPPLVDLPLLNLDLIAQLSAGALAVGAIGLVETTAIARSISTRTGQRLDSNQEFVGVGLANVAAGFFSGYPCAGSFSRSAVNHAAGASTPMSAIFSSAFVLLSMFLLAPLGAYLPRTALSAVLIVTGIGMINYQEIARIFRGARADAFILAVTFLGTLFLHIEFAVLAGILLSFGLYIMNTSVPKVFPVLPDDRFRHLEHRPDRPACPQLGLIELRGDMYFGAISHVESAIHSYQETHPDQRFLLLRMQSVNHCDFSGIHGLETIVRSYRDKGGDLYLSGVQGPVRELMESTGFDDYLGEDRFVSAETAIDHIFHRVLDPAICIYECPVRAFRECQNLPKRELQGEALHLETDREVEGIEPRRLWEQLRGDSPPQVVDVRERREFSRGHIPEARLIPFPRLPSSLDELSRDVPLVLVCRGGRRSRRAACLLLEKGFGSVAVVKGGMLGWEAAGLLEALD